MPSYVLKQSSASQPLVFLMVDSADHITGKAGLSPTVTISKNGSIFNTPTGVVAELANGWYRVAPNATDTNTLGTLLLHATATGADPCDALYQVVAYDPLAAAGLGLTNLDATVSSRSTFSGGAVASVTAPITLPGIPANWITAAGINTAAFNGKGDWLLSTGYTAPPTAAAVATQVDSTLTASHGSGSWGGGGSGAAPTTAEIAAAILLTPANKLATNGTGQVQLDWGQAVTLSPTDGTTGDVYWGLLNAGTVGDVANQVDVTLTASHGSGSWGGGGGGTGADPWLTPLPGSYAAGTAGYILGNRLDVAVSTRSTYAGGAVASVTAPVTLPTIPASWITSAGIAPAALNGKGDWLLSSGYTVPPTAAAIATQVDTSLSAGHGSGAWGIAATAPAGWITAASIATSALNGKGDWLASSSYTAPPSAAAIAGQVDTTLTSAHGVGSWALGSSAPANWITSASVATSALNGKGDWLTSASYTAPPSAVAIANQVDTTLTSGHGVGSWSIGTTAPANWINAAAVASSALNGKGDWLTTAGYTVPPTSAAIATQVDTTLTGSHGSGSWGGGGSGGGATASEVAAAILVTPANKLATTAAGAISLNLAQGVPIANTPETVGDALNAARAQGFGKWSLVGTALTLYAANGTTVVRSFTLDNASAPTIRS